MTAALPVHCQTVSEGDAIGAIRCLDALQQLVDDLPTKAIAALVASLAASTIGD